MLKWVLGRGITSSLTQTLIERAKKEKNERITRVFCCCFAQELYKFFSNIIKSSLSLSYGVDCV